MKKYSRSEPYISYLKERELLTGSFSSKKTYHIVLDTSSFSEMYKVGDSIGILPSNDPKEVELILDAIQAKGDEKVLDHRKNERVSIYDFLTHRTNLTKLNRSFLSLLVEKGLAIDPSLIESYTMLDFLRLQPLLPEEIAKFSMPLLPRFYSIASSQKVFSDEIHLLVAYVEYLCNGKPRRGVGSHFLCDLAQIGSTPISFYVQPSQHFTLPKDSSTSIIMVGPGTGVAPFRAFIQERIASRASGRNWLFFGERNQEFDFYYRSFWEDLAKQGHLRLDAAFSRDQEEKIYVQHKMYEQRKSLWQWIESGALIYVCGDANQMAKDVDAMLHRIVKEEGGYSEVDANLYVKKMRQDKRYLTDVY